MMGIVELDKTPSGTFIFYNVLFQLQEFLKFKTDTIGYVQLAKQIDHKEILSENENLMQEECQLDRTDEKLYRRSCVLIQYESKIRIRFVPIDIFKTKALWTENGCFN